MAYSRCGMTPELFWGLTWEEFNYMVDHTTREQNREAKLFRKVATEIRNSNQRIKLTSWLTEEKYWALPDDLIKPEAQSTANDFWRVIQSNMLKNLPLN